MCVDRLTGWEKGRGLALVLLVGGGFVSREGYRAAIYCLLLPLTIIVFVVVEV